MYIRTCITHILTQTHTHTECLLGWRRAEYVAIQVYVLFLKDTHTTGTVRGNPSIFLIFQGVCVSCVYGRMHCNTGVCPLS